MTISDKLMFFLEDFAVRFDTRTEPNYYIIRLMGHKIFNPLVLNSNNTECEWSLISDPPYISAGVIMLLSFIKYVVSILHTLSVSSQVVDCFSTRVWEKW